MTFRVPFWYRFHKRDMTGEETPVSFVAGTRITIISDETDEWFDDWLFVDYVFPEIRTYLATLSAWPVLGAEMVYDPEYTQWTSNTYADFDVPGDGILFAMWAKTELITLQKDVRDRGRDFDEPYTGIIFKMSDKERWAKAQVQI